jgi:hypothetical protein
MAKPTIQQARDRAEWLAISVRPSVTRKKSRSPETVLFMLAAEMPSDESRN